MYALKYGFFCSISTPTPTVISNSDQEITLEFGIISGKYLVTFVCANVLISAR